MAEETIQIQLTWNQLELLADARPVHNEMNGDEAASIEYRATVRGSGQRKMLQRLAGKELIWPQMFRGTEGEYVKLTPRGVQVREKAIAYLTEHGRR